MKGAGWVILFCTAAAGGAGLLWGGPIAAWAREARLDVAPVSDETYRQECGACHLAYPPGLLPARSWQRVMAGLADHFGENAELSGETAAAIARYLAQNAAEHDGHKRPTGILRSLPEGSMPLRITETPYFMTKHHHLPATAVRDNPKVRSFSNCDACHRRPAEGSFNEREVAVPGAG